MTPGTGQRFVVRKLLPAQAVDNAGRFVRNLMMPVGHWIGRGQRSFFSPRAAKRLASCKMTLQGEAAKHALQRAIPDPLAIPDFLKRKIRELT